MRRRLFGALAVLVVLMAALPFSATAATNVFVVRVTATSWTDTAGSETNSLCAVPTGTPAPIETTISASSTAEDIVPSGSGTMTLTPLGSGLQMAGQIDSESGPLPISVEVLVTCLTPGYAIFTYSITSVAFINGAYVNVAVTLAGNITDGVHPNQGRMSMNLTYRILGPAPAP